MEIQHGSLPDFKRDLLGIFGKHLDLTEYKIFFFGSRVEGNNMPRSDIDIGVFGPQKIPPVIKFNIEEDLEKLPLLYKIDLVDFQVVSESFKNEAMKSIERLN